jgi:hypothetical protein
MIQLISTFIRTQLEIDGMIRGSSHVGSPLQTKCPIVTDGRSLSAILIWAGSDDIEELMAWPTSEVFS